MAKGSRSTKDDTKIFNDVEVATGFTTAAKTLVELVETSMEDGEKGLDDLVKILKDMTEDKETFPRANLALLCMTLAIYFVKTRRQMRERAHRPESVTFVDRRIV